jgi:preprotein translocase subunit YajC
MWMLLLAAQAGEGNPMGAGGGSLVSYLIMIGLIFVVFYFLVFRPERKRRKKLQEMVSELKPGDKVITIGGIHGTVSGVTEKSVVVRVSDQTKIEFTKQAIGTVITPEGEVVEADKK